MTFIQSVIGIVFGCFMVMALTATPFIYIVVDGIAASIMATICGLCGLLCHTFLSAAEQAERRQREDIQHQLRWKARNNG